MADELVLREARSDDAEHCGEIAVVAWQCVHRAWRGLLGEALWAQHYAGWEDRKRNDVAGYVRQFPERTFVTECGGQVVGFLTWFLPGPEGVGEIGNNAVHPDWQGRGIGGAQVRAALARFRELGLTSATVYTGLDDGHAPARAMYEAAGFDLTTPHVRYFMEL